MSEQQLNTQKELIKVLTETWQQYPELRLTQLIINAITPQGPCPEVFYTTDKQLAEKLKLLPKKMLIEDKKDTSTDSIEDILTLHREIINCLGSSAGTDVWLYTKLPTLNNQRPIDCISTSQGRAHIRQILSQMRHRKP